MVSKKKREELMERIIDLSQSVEDREVDPFEVDVEDFLERLDEIFSEMDNPEELLLDVEAILGLSDVISQQRDWIKHKSSLLNFTPMLVKWKAKNLSKKQLSYVLVNSWHPIAEMESIAKPGIKEAIEYWNDLDPISERGAELDTEERETEEISRDSLPDLGFDLEEDFDEMIEKTWKKLKNSTGENSKISYWDFIDQDNFRETAINAWLTSFLISYGYASIEINPLEEEITLEVREEKNTSEKESGTSVPIAISYEDWKNRRNENA